MSKKLYLMGLGLDDDGHMRITKSEDFTLMGGSQKTHTQMQETMIKIDEEAKKRGKHICDLDLAEAQEVVNQIIGDRRIG